MSMGYSSRGIVLSGLLVITHNGYRSPKWITRLRCFPTQGETFQVGAGVCETLD